MESSAGDRGQRGQQAVRRHPRRRRPVVHGRARARSSAFLGPNGAGKTTTLRILLGLVNATGGTATIDGRPYGALEDPVGTVGAVLDGGMFHPGRSGRNHLRGLARASGVADARVDELLELVGAQGRREPARRRLLARHAPAARARGRAARRPARCSSSTSPPTGSTRRASAGCATSCARSRARAGRCSSPATCWPRSRRPPTRSWSSRTGRSVAQAPLAELTARVGRRHARRRPRRGPAGRGCCAPTAPRSTTDGERAIVVRGRSGEEIGRVIAAGRDRHLRARAGRLVARGDLLRAHRRRGRAVVSRAISAELFKLRTTRTSWGVIARRDRPGRADQRDRGARRQLRRHRRRRRGPAGDRRARPALRARARHPRRRDRVPPRHDHAEPARRPRPHAARARQADRAPWSRARCSGSPPRRCAR